MKPTVYILMSIAILLTFSRSAFSQKASSDGWVRIYYVVGGDGKELAKRCEGDSTWTIRNPEKALENMYHCKETIEQKYKLATAILVLLNPNGTPSDQIKYNEAVLRYNQFIKQNRL